MSKYCGFILSAKLSSGRNLLAGTKNDALSIFAFYCRNRAKNRSIFDIIISYKQKLRYIFEKPHTNSRNAVHCFAGVLFSYIRHVLHLSSCSHVTFEPETYFAV